MKKKRVCDHIWWEECVNSTINMLHTTNETVFFTCKNSEILKCNHSSTDKFCKLDIDRQLFSMNCYKSERRMFDPAMTSHWHFQNGRHADQKSLIGNAEGSLMRLNGAERRLNGRFVSCIMIIGPSPHDILAICVWFDQSQPLWWGVWRIATTRRSFINFRSNLYL